MLDNHEKARINIQAFFMQKHNKVQVYYNYLLG